MITLPLIGCEFNYVFDWQVLEEIDRWGVNIFRISELSNNRPLTAVTYAIFKVVWDYRNVQIQLLHVPVVCRNEI